MRTCYLKAVTLSGVTYVQDIHYDAKGQRQAIWYGNGTKTSYDYDPATFRLQRLLTVNLTTNETVQDLNYWYDPVGNITHLIDGAQQTLFYANQIITPDQDFTYDALYRLIVASGREQKNNASNGGADNWDDKSYRASLGGDAAQNYTQQYSYDAVGNILTLQHFAAQGSFTRNYNYAFGTNKLVSTDIGSTVYTYGHDVRGNMTSMPHLLQMSYDLQNQMVEVTQGSVKACYQYSGGQRIRKIVFKPGGIMEERLYLGNYEVYREYDGAGNLELERTTVHVSDDTGRIAMVETRTQGTDPDPAVLSRYQYSNHLQSATLELDENGNIISYEEYHPYGTTAYQAMNANIQATAKRYRFTGKERDEESGLYYHGARYYAPWLGRWCAVDPLESKYSPLSPYNYGFCNPITYTDPSGMGPEDPIQVDLKEVVIHASRRYDAPIATPPTTLSVADNTATWQMNPEKVEQDLKASQQASFRSVIEGSLGGSNASFNAVSEYDWNRRRENTQQRELEIRKEKIRELDPLAYDLGNSPGVQGGLKLVGTASAMRLLGANTSFLKELGATGTYESLKELAANRGNISQMDKADIIFGTAFNLIGNRLVQPVDKMTVEGLSGISNVLFDWTSEKGFKAALYNKDNRSITVDAISEITKLSIGKMNFPVKYPEPSKDATKMWIDQLKWEVNDSTSLFSIK